MYVPVKTKFALSLTLANLWLFLSIYLSRFWVADLAHHTGWFLSIFIITFIAYVPATIHYMLDDEQAATGPGFG